MTSATPQVFKAPIVSFDLRPEEAIFQSLQSIEYLTKCVDEVFDSVLQKVNQQKQELSQVMARSENAKAKVDGLVGKTKATVVFSAPKYPAPKKLPDFQPVFATKEVSSVANNSNDFMTTQCPISMVRAKNPADVFKVLVEKRTRERDIHMEKEGLGPIPNNTSYINSLLLFNSAENPYKKYVSLDNLAGEEANAQGPGDDKKELAAAPMSVLEGDELSALQGESYSFNPSLGPVPELGLPSMLPDLPGVVDDLSFDSAAVDLPAIAPSQVLAGIVNLPSVPAIEGPPPDPNAPPPQPQDTGAPPPPGPSAAAPPPPPPGPAAAAPPPPPPPGPAAAPPPPPPPAAAPGPPPPPPPAAAPGPPPPPGPAAPAPPPPAPAAQEEDTSGGGRGGMLADIRNFGGNMKKLKKVSDEEKRDASKPDVPGGESEDTAAGSSSSGGGGGGGLMGDLMSRLKNRRKGISGDKSPKKAPAKPPPQQEEAASGFSLSKMAGVSEAMADDDSGSGSDWSDDA